MDKTIQSTLQELGLTNGEISTYSALVELGSVTVGPIIDMAHISSSKVYIILEKLIQKGLVTYIIKEKTKYFQAAAPSSLMEYLEEKEKKLDKTKKNLKETILKLEKKQKTKTTDEAKIYRGYNGLKTAWSEAIKKIPDKGEYYFFSIGYGEDPYLKRFFKQLSMELKKRKIKIRGIANIKERKLYNQYYKKLGYDMRYTTLSLPSDMTVAGDSILTFVWDKKEPVVYVLQSKILFNSYLNFLKEMWLEGKK